MNNISKLGEDIENRLKGIEATQDESSKIIIELNNRLITLENHVRDTHRTFNLLLENINQKNKTIDNRVKNMKKIESDSDSDSDSSSEDERKKRKNKNKNTNSTNRSKNRSNRSTRLIF